MDAQHHVDADFLADHRKEHSSGFLYTPAATPFLKAAAAAGLKTLPGLPMLIYQGALAFELWTGVHAPVDVMAEAARKALAAREARK